MQTLPDSALEVKIPGHVSWTDPTLSPRGLVQALKQSFLNYRAQSWWRWWSFLSRTPKHPRYVTEAVALLEDLEETMAVDNVSADSAYRRLIRCRRLIAITQERRFRFYGTTRALAALLLAEELQWRASHKETPDEESEANRREAVHLFDEAIRRLNKRTNADWWMYAEAEKGTVLSDLASSGPAETQTDLARASVQCWDEALSVCVRERFADEWITLHHMKALGLLGIATSETGRPKVEVLRQLIRVCDEVLAIVSVETNRESWTISNRFKQDALYLLSLEIPREFEESVLRELVVTSEKLIAAYARTEHSIEAADSHFMKGMALSAWCELVGIHSTQGDRASRHAIECFDQALEGIPREVDPERWALTQYFRGRLFLKIRWYDVGRHIGNAGRLREALEGFEQALTVVTEDDNPGTWAEINDYKGDVLGQLAGFSQTFRDESDGWTDVQRLELYTDVQRLELYTDAIASYDAALRGFARTENVSGWAAAQHNKGKSLCNVAQLLDAADRLDTFRRAIVCFDEALKVQVQEKDDSFYRQTLAIRRRADEDARAAEAELLTTSSVPSTIELGGALDAQLIADISFEEMGVGLSIGPGNAYQELPDLLRARETLRDLVAGTDQKHFGLLIQGKPLSGKTTLALELLKQEAADFYFLFWFPIFHLTPSDIRSLRGKRLIFYLEQPHVWLFEEPNARLQEDDRSEFQATVEALQAVCERFVIVATDNVERETSLGANALGPLCSKFRIVTVSALFQSEPEIAQMTHSMELAMRAAEGEWRESAQVSTPLELQQRISTLRAPGFPGEALAILRSIWLLRAIELELNHDARVRSVAMRLFGLPDTPASWEDGRAWLIQQGWVTAETDPVNGLPLLVPKHESYVDRAVVSAFPVDAVKMAQYMSQLASMFGADPVDLDGVAALCEALVDQLNAVPDTYRPALYETLRSCIEWRLPSLDRHKPDAWVRAYLLLGVAYSNCVEGGKVDNLNMALDAYRIALEECSRESDPRLWSRLHWNSAITHGKLALLLKSDSDNHHLIEAMQEFSAALSVRTRETSPKDWADIYAFMGALLAAEGGKLVAAAGRPDASQAKAAAKELREALSIVHKDQAPENWAVLQQALGSTYLRTAQEQGDGDIDAALEALTAALSIQEDQPEAKDTAITHMLVASCHNVRLQRVLERRTGSYTTINDPLTVALCRATLEECNKALPVLTQTSAPDEWTSLKLFQSLSYFLLSVSDQGQRETTILARDSAQEALNQLEGSDNLDTVRELWFICAQASMQLAVEDESDTVSEDPLEPALEVVERALKVTPRAQSPVIWAFLQLLRGQGYASRLDGDESSNIETAIDALTMASSVLDKKSHPVQWGVLCAYLAVCYRDRIRGSRRANRRMAAQMCRAARAILIEEDVGSDLLRAVAELAQELDEDSGKRRKKIEDNDGNYRRHQSEHA